MKLFWILNGLIALIAVNAHSQPLSYTIMDDEVRKVWDIWEEENTRSTTVRVWRVLIAGVESRRTLNKEIEKFKRNFPDMPYDWSYDAPFYKLKVGAELQRLSIKPLYYKLKETYSSVLEIRDEIETERYFEIHKYEP